MGLSEYRLERLIETGRLKKRGRKRRESTKREREEE